MRPPSAPCARPRHWVRLPVTWATWITCGLSAWTATGAQAQNTARPSAPPPAASLACAQPSELTTRHLYGPWEALLVHTLPAPATTRPAPGATVRFERHPDHADSLRGTLHTQQPATAWPTEAQLSGDVDGGELVLDESDDGQRITAVWVGTAVPGTCGQEIQGTRRLADESTGTHFVLKRTAGW